MLRDPKMSTKSLDATGSFLGGIEPILLGLMLTHKAASESIFP